MLFLIACRYNQSCNKEYINFMGGYKMKRKVLSIILTGAMVAAMFVGCGSKADAPAEAPAADALVEAPVADAPVEAPAAEEPKAEEPAADAAGGYADKKVGVCIYQFSDNFMTLFRTELENYLVSLGFAKDNIKIMDGQNDQATQSQQIDAFIAEGVDVLIIDPVNSSSAATITDKVVGANIPLVYINREPDAAEEQRWQDNGWNVTYVGCDARQSGTMQGEMIVDLGKDKVDLNGDGKIQYIMVEGDPENVDAQYRTEFSVKALTDAGWEVECLDDQVGNWQQAEAQQIVANALGQYADKIEVVFCNNDSMALGALQAIEAAGRVVNENIYLTGVDALSEALENVINGKMTGTVFNDHFSQSRSAADAAVRFVDGETNEYYIGCDYVKVTTDNAQAVLDMVK